MQSTVLTNKKAGTLRYRTKAMHIYIKEGRGCPNVIHTTNTPQVLPQINYKTSGRSIEHQYKCKCSWEGSKTHNLMFTTVSVSLH